MFYEFVTTLPFNFLKIKKRQSFILTKNVKSYKKFSMTAFITRKFKFYIDEDTPKNYIDKWILFKKACDSGIKTNREVAELWIKNCKLETNKNLPILDRFEGGLGGGDITDKQIRFNLYTMNGIYTIHRLNKFIYFDIIVDTNINKWSNAELEDLLNAFIIVANEYIGFNCVSGKIIKQNKIIWR